MTHNDDRKDVSLLRKAFATSGAAAWILAAALCFTYFVFVTAMGAGLARQLWALFLMFVCLGVTTVIIIFGFGEKEVGDKLN
jgi:uncharacterized membrane protein